MLKKIAVLTGDCAGLNASIRSVVRLAAQYDTDVVHVMKGYDGLLRGKSLRGLRE